MHCGSLSPNNAEFGLLLLLFCSKSCTFIATDCFAVFHLSFGDILFPAALVFCRRSLVIKLFQRKQNRFLKADMLSFVV